MSEHEPLTLSDELDPAGNRVCAAVDWDVDRPMLIVLLELEDGGRRGLAPCEARELGVSLVRAAGRLTDWAEEQ